MRKLFLFDVDRTLIITPSTGRFIEAIKNLHGINIDSEKLQKEFHGLTDPLILTTILENNGWDDKQAEAAMPGLIKELDRVYAQSFKSGSVKILPGVKDLLKALYDSDVALGLIAGNLKATAMIKLKDVGIDKYFNVGAYGDDIHKSRAELVRVAIKNAGYTNNIDLVYVIGDTARDIEAARQAGVINTVGVANGFRDTSELEAAGAKIVLEDFLDTETILSKLKG